MGSVVALVGVADGCLSCYCAFVFWCVVVAGVGLSWSLFFLFFVRNFMVSVCMLHAHHIVHVPLARLLQVFDRQELDGRHAVPDRVQQQEGLRANGPCGICLCPG